MHLFLIRHAQTKHSDDHRYQGTTDAPLNETGKLQAEEIAKRLNDKKIEAIYSSDLQRSVQTADFIAKEHKLPINQDERLREISFGDWEGMSYNEIQAQFPDLLEQWINDPAHHSPPNGETLTQLASRVKSAIDEIKSKHTKENQTVLLVTHGGVIRTLLCMVLGVELNSHLQFDCATGSLSIISFYDEYANLRLLNDISHLQK
jgi:alpha-ribazole phosphatase